MNALRMLLASAILVWLVSRIPLDELKRMFQEGLQQWPWWVAALAFTLLGLLAGCIRWHTILRSQGFLLPFPTTFRLFFIGQFFNSFLPGGCGGDLARAWYAARLCDREKTRAASTVLVDRAIGLLVTLYFGCLMVWIRWRLIAEHRLLLLCAAVMVGAALGVTFLIFLAFRRHLFLAFPFFQRLETSRFGGVLRNVYEAAYACREQPQVLPVCLAYSLLNLFFLTLACLAFGRSLLIPLPPMDYFTLFPMITILTAIPITPGALGVREGLFAELFKTVGVATYRTIPLSLLVYLGGLFWSLFGGLLYILQPREKRLAFQRE